MDITYPEIGATRTLPLPAGYDHAVRTAVIGSGREAFEKAAEGLFALDMHRFAGLRPPDGGTVTDGATLVFRAPLGLRVPCRIVYVVAEEHRRGFAYGTLPGHPERGEEAFFVSLSPGDGTVTAEIRAFSRPATLLTRLGGPLTRLVQKYATSRYLAGLRDLARR